MLYVLRLRHPHWNYDAIRYTTTLENNGPDCTVVEVEFRYPAGNKSVVKMPFTSGNFVRDIENFTNRVVKELEKLGAVANSY